MCVKRRVRLLRDLLCHVRVLLLHKDRGMNLRPTVISFFRERDHERSASWEGSYNLNYLLSSFNSINRREQSTAFLTHQTFRSTEALSA